MIKPAGDGSGYVQHGGPIRKDDILVVVVGIGVRERGEVKGNMISIFYTPVLT